MSNHDHGHYVVWRKSRIDKLEKIFGRDYFRDKKILECGAGNGMIGKHLREEWGADVRFTEGRKELVEVIEMYNPGAMVYHLNHEKPWHIGRFDFIIHWGLLYHLNAWKNDLTYTINSLKRGGVLALESEVLNYDTVKEVKVSEPIEWDDQAVSGIGTQMTAAAVEDELTKLGVRFVRYDDSDLNAGFHHYDWKVTNTGSCAGGQRRFWICYT